MIISDYLRKLAMKPQQLPIELAVEFDDDKLSLEVEPDVRKAQAGPQPSSSHSTSVSYPDCPDHHVKMVCRDLSHLFYWGFHCPIEGCKQTAKWEE